MTNPTGRSSSTSTTEPTLRSRISSAISRTGARAGGDHRLRHDLADQHARRVYNRRAVADRTPPSSPAAAGSRRVIRRRGAVARPRCSSPATASRASPAATRSTPSRRGRHGRADAARRLARGPRADNIVPSWRADRPQNPSTGRPDSGRAPARPRSSARCSRSPAASAASIVRNGAPSPGWLESLRAAAAARPVGARPSLRTPLSSSTTTTPSGCWPPVHLRGIGFLLAGVGAHLPGRATHARRREFPRLALYLPLARAALLARPDVLIGIGTMVAAHDFLDGPRTVERGQRHQRVGLLVAGSLAPALAGLLALGSAFVLICLNAMRAGLLTRFMGCSASSAACSIVLPIVAPACCADLLARRARRALPRPAGPAGVPPAWTSGRAEPWPSQQEAREARRGPDGVPPRERARAGAGARGRVRSR